MRMSFLWALQQREIWLVCASSTLGSARSNPVVVRCAPQILVTPFLKKYIFSFIKDIVDRCGVELAIV